MPGKHLRRCASRRGVLRCCALALVLANVSCRTPQPEPEPATATRAEVTDALYRQLELVLERHDNLVLKKTAATADEQGILVELATEIAIRIVRIDPRARLDHSGG